MPSRKLFPLCSSVDTHTGAKQRTLTGKPDWRDWRMSRNTAAWEDWEARRKSRRVTENILALVIGMPPLGSSLVRLGRGSNQAH